MRTDSTVVGFYSRNFEYTVVCGNKWGLHFGGLACCPSGVRRIPKSAKLT